MLHRLIRTFFAPDGAAGSGSDTAAGDGEDAGFVTESASVAFTPAPDDTTARDDGETREVSASAEAPIADGDEIHAGAEAREEATAAAATSGAAETGAAKAGEAAGKPGKARKTGDKRAAEIQREIDTLTYNKHRTAEETQQLAAKKQQLETEIAALETKKAAGTGASEVKPGETAAAAAAEDAEPEHPKYRDFGTDEEYEAAVAKWRTDHRVWNTRQIDQLKKDITTGVEARFTSADQELARRAAMSTFSTTLQKVHADHAADWDEKAAALETVQSSWFDPRKHVAADGTPITTPFLSDLCQTLLMQGKEEGGHLLHWLGSDTDRAQRVADLLPTRPLRDALVNAPSVTPLLEFFASDEGAKEFETLKQMHPIQMMQAVGALSVRLQPAPRGSGATAHPITKATPSARPQVGSPAARATTTSESGQQPPKTSNYLDWHIEEDVKEIMAKARAIGQALSAEDARTIAVKRLVG